MRRLQKFSCAAHGSFEILLDVDASKCDGRFLSVESRACPACGESAPPVISSPAMRPDNVHLVEFGGRLHERESIEKALDRDDKKPQFWDAPDFEQDFLRRTARATKRYLDGDLPPADFGVPDEAAKQVVDGAIASADIEAIKASQDQVTNLFRKTEFPE